MGIVKVDAVMQGKTWIARRRCGERGEGFATVLCGKARYETTQDAPEAYWTGDSGQGGEEITGCETRRRGGVVNVERSPRTHARHVHAEFRSLHGVTSLVTSSLVTS